MTLAYKEKKVPRVYKEKLEHLVQKDLKEIKAQMVILDLQEEEEMQVILVKEDLAAHKENLDMMVRKDLRVLMADKAYAEKEVTQVSLEPQEQMELMVQQVLLDFPDCQVLMVSEVPEVQRVTSWLAKSSSTSESPGDNQSKRSYFHKYAISRI